MDYYEIRAVNAETALHNLEIDHANTAKACAKRFGQYQAKVKKLERQRDALLAVCEVVQGYMTGDTEPTDAFMHAMVRQLNETIDSTKEF